MLFVKTKTSKNNYIQSSQIGVEAINRANIERADKLNVVVGDYVHVNWRKEYIHVCYTAELAKKKKKSDTFRQKPRSSQPSFNFKTKYSFYENGVIAREKLSKAALAALSKYKEIEKCYWINQIPWLWWMSVNCIWTYGRVQWSACWRCCISSYLLFQF